MPLFLAGGEGDRAFARFYPTIAIDGCDKRCAAKATELYSGKRRPTSSWQTCCESETVETLIALPAILQQFREQGTVPGNGVTHALLDMVKIYNSVPAEQEASYLSVFEQEYTAFCARQ